MPQGPLLVDFHRKAGHTVDMRAGLARVAHFGHSDHAKDQGAGHLGAFQGNGRYRCEMVHHQLVPMGKFGDAPFVILGIDDLQYTQNITIAVLQGDGQDRLGLISGGFIEPLAEAVRQGGLEAVYVPDIQGAPGGSDISGDAFGIDGDLEGRVDEFFISGKLLLEGIVLGV